MNRSATRTAILILGLATALIHWYLLLNFFDPPFLLNGLGYLALLAAFFRPPPFLAGRERLVRVVFIGYTLVTILAWAAVGDKQAPIAYVDKAIELLLIAALWLDLRTLEPPPR